MTNFNERMNTLLYKNMYLSHFILDVSVVCERWVETGTDCYIDPTSSPDHSSTYASWLGLLNRGSLALTLAFLSPTDSTATGTSLYSFITSTCFCFFFCLFTQVHLLIDSSVKGQYITINNILHQICFNILKWLRLNWPDETFIHEPLLKNKFSFDLRLEIFADHVTKLICLS